MGGKPREEKNKGGRPQKHGAKLIRYVLRLPPDLHVAIKKTADEQGVSMNDVILASLSTECRPAERRS